MFCYIYYMISYFSAKNFYSIGDEIEVDFVSRLSSPKKGNLYFESAVGEKMTKIAFVGGGNASGKTNILRIPAFFKYLITKSSDTDADRGIISFFPFASKLKEPSSLSVCFSLDNSKEYIYSVELNMDKIFYEELKTVKKNKERISRKKVFSRKWNDEKKSYDVDFVELKSLKNYLEAGEMLKENPHASFISIFANYDTTREMIDIKNYWKNVSCNVNIISNRETMGDLSAMAQRSLNRMSDSSEFSKKLSKLLRKYDIGFNSIKREKEINNVGREIITNSIFHIYEKNVAFDLPLPLESTGTHKMIILLESIINALTIKGGVAIIDEMDAYLHPDIMEDLFNLFADNTINKNNSQLIFSSHNYMLLNKLDKQQIFFCEKNKKGQTEITRLDDYENVRSDDNFFVKYLAGSYGARPRIGEVDV